MTCKACKHYADCLKLNRIAAYKGETNLKEGMENAFCFTKQNGPVKVSETDVIKIRMLVTVRANPIIAMPGTVLREGKEYMGMSNPLGAITAKCDNGENMGVKPNEFEFIEAPSWVLDIWNIHERK